MNRRSALSSLCGLLFVFLAGCNDDDKPSVPKVGSNDINTVLCMGDSITDGECVPAGAPYPSRLAVASGKRVINAGICGERSEGGAGGIGGLMKRYKPGYVVIYYGANDVIRSVPPASFEANLRSMINQVKANESLPIVCTLTPMYDSHAGYQPGVQFFNGIIRTVARESGVRLVSLDKQFGTKRELLQEDGLHPSDDGTRVIAAAVNDRI